MEEMLDLVNEQGDSIGRAVPRSEAHRLGLRHRTSHLRSDASSGTRST